MSTIKVFHRKTKKGSVIKVVREHYLRDDLHCGLENCIQCAPFKFKPTQQFAPPAYLSENPRVNLNKLCPQRHYIIPDCDVLVQQIDVISDNSFGNDIILLQTVINDVRKTVSIYSRIKDLMQERRFYVFCNEFHRQTFVEREFGESMDEYKQRLIQVAIQWLKLHFGQIDVVFLYNHEANLNGVINFPCYKFNDYVMNLANNVNLLDKLVDVSTSQNEKDFQYEEHKSMNEIQAGVKNGKYFQGKYHTSRDNFLEGFVNIENNGEDVMVLIQGRDYINRAVHDDIVAIELLPQSQWKTHSNMVLIDDENAEEETENQINLKENKSKPSSQMLKPTGKVIGIIKRNWRQYCGVLRLRNENMNKSSIMTRYIFIPAERRIPAIRIETRQYEVLKGQRIIVAIDSWDKNSKYPQGHYVRALGNIGDKETENEVLLLENDVPHSEFSAAVMKCLPSENWEIPQDEIRKRFDLRNECIVSVDPPDCTDIDDALHCKDLGNGIYEIGVHIADVSYFMQANTALDKEAANRGTSVYLVDRRIDMIPPILSSNLCSLRQDCERLTFSVIWKIQAKTGDVKSTLFTKGIIKSKGALSYDEAQLKIDSPNDKSEIAQSLRRLNSVAKLLKAKRLESGALILASGMEYKFVEIDSETHENNLGLKQLRETNSMVEEFMLLANISVAKKIYEEFPHLALLRRHPKPSPSNFDELINAGKHKGIEIDVSDGKSLSSSLKATFDPKNPLVNLMFRMIATRCMTEALYFCTGSVSNPEENFNHFGLAVPLYTHFTSPIRRYADVIVHRLLAHSIGLPFTDIKLLNNNKMQQLCDNINYRHRMAKNANRASMLLHTIIDIKNSEKIVQNGYIIFVRKNAMQIFLPKLAFEVTYFVNDSWEYNELKNSHLHEKVELKQFDSVTVQIGIRKDEAVNRKARIEVKIIQPEIDV